jgi:hypothetical protein
LRETNNVKEGNQSVTKFFQKSRNIMEKEGGNLLLINSVLTINV